MPGRGRHARLARRSAAEPVDEATARELRERADREQRERGDEAARYREAARREGYQIWVSGWAPEDGGPVRQYLRLRGLDFTGHPDPGVLERLKLREYDRLPWREGRSTLHTGPAMLAAVTRPDGRFGAVHQTWIDLAQPKGKIVLPPDEKGKARDARKSRGSVQGGAIRRSAPHRPSPSSCRFVMARRGRTASSTATRSGCAG